VTCLNANVNRCVYHVSYVAQLITPALRKYPMENTTSIPKGYVTENWSDTFTRTHLSILDSSLSLVSMRANLVTYLFFSGSLFIIH